MSGRLLVSLKEVSIRRGAVQVLDRISWSLREGEAWLISGGNGAGKSTFLRLVNGDLWPDAHSGRRLYHFPEPAPSESPIGARDLMRTVSAEQQDRYTRFEQTISLLDVVRSGWKDVTYPQGTLPARIEDRARSLLSELGLGGMEERGILDVSHGQARRALVARALLAEPRILILDEVFNGLDHASRTLLMDFVDRQISTGATVVMTSHRPGEASASISREMALEGGRIVWNGSRRNRAESAPPPPQPPAAPRMAEKEILLEIRNVDVAIEGTPILSGLNWEWRRGEHWLVSGANGSGKTTFLRLLYGDLVPTLGGIVRRLDLPERSSIWEIRDRVGYVAPELQARYHGGWSGLELVMSGDSSSVGLYGQPVEGLAEQGHAMMERLGISHLANRPAEGLSYGQMRQALVARALLRPRALLLLDEPFNGLDGDWCRRLATVLVEAVEGGTHLLVVSHHQEEAAHLFNRHAEFLNGRINFQD